jgi:hypothetical protein
MTDFIIVRYSASNNSLPSNNRIRLQGNVVKVDRTWDSIETPFAPTILN